MSDDQNISTGSETSVAPETAAQAATPEVATSQDTATETTGSAAEGTTVTTTDTTQPQQGDACVCPDGRNGTFWVFDGHGICLPNIG